MNKFDRVMSVLVLLQSRRVVKAQDIADRFEVSLRTVYRDIRTLEFAGVPIVGEAGVGYALAEGYKLPPVMFDETEALAMIAAEKFMANTMDEQLTKAFSSAAAKIRAVLRSDDRESAERLDDSIVMRGQGPKYSTNYLTEIFSAISGKQVLRIDYKKIDSETPDQRHVEPVGSYFQNNTWYLIAWCRLRQAYRTFRVERIHSLVCSGERFKAIHPSVHEYIASEAKRMKSYRVVVQFPTKLAHYVENDRLSFGLVAQETVGEFTRMTFLTSSLEYFARWVMMYTSYVEVIEPTSLKDIIRGFIEELIAHYPSEQVKR